MHAHYDDELGNTMIAAFISLIHYDSASKVSTCYTHTITLIIGLSWEYGMWEVSYSLTFYKVYAHWFEIFWETRLRTTLVEWDRLTDDQLYAYFNRLYWFRWVLKWKRGTCTLKALCMLLKWRHCKG